MPSRTFICQVLCLPRVSLPHNGFERLAWFPISVLTRISIETCTLDSYFPPIPSPNSASSFFHTFSSLCLLSTQTWNLDSFCFFVSCQILQAQSKVKSRQNSFVSILLDIFFFYTFPVICTMQTFWGALFPLPAFSSSVTPAYNMFCLPHSFMSLALTATISSYPWKGTIFFSLSFKEQINFPLFSPFLSLVAHAFSSQWPIVKFC